jgi:hypothetical protein
MFSSRPSATRHLNIQSKHYSMHNTLTIGHSGISQDVTGMRWVTLYTGPHNRLFMPKHAAIEHLRWSHLAPPGGSSGMRCWVATSVGGCLGEPIFNPLNALCIYRQDGPTLCSSIQKCESNKATISLAVYNSTDSSSVWCQASRQKIGNGNFIQLE